jgi:ketosteroid isomerase-like protein
MLAGSSVGAKRLQWQRFDVQQVVEHGNEVIIRVTRTGKVAAPAGSFEAGQDVRAHLAQLIRTRHGRNQQIETYDCFDPLM